MNNQTIHLKIKVKSLAAEARIIRQEELRWKGGPGSVRESLYCHRVGLLRRESRHAQLAAAYIRNRHRYAEVEASPKSPPRWVQVEKLIKRFGGDPKNLTHWKGGWLNRELEQAKSA